MKEEWMGWQKPKVQENHSWMLLLSFRKRKIDKKLEEKKGTFKAVYGHGENKESLENEKKRSDIMSGVNTN